MTTGDMLLFRGIWADAATLRELSLRRPILPNGVESIDEWGNLLSVAIYNFGSLRGAALHHLTGATGTAPNVTGKPVFTFWTRKRSIALERLARGVGLADARDQAVIIEADVAPSERVIVAQDAGLYRETISASLDATFEDFAPEDEVFVAVPVYAYDFQVLSDSDLIRP